MVRVPRLPSDDRAGSEERADPDLVDALERDIVHDAVAPSDAAVLEGVAQTWLEETEDGVAGRGVEVAAEDERRVAGQRCDSLRHGSELLAAGPAVGGLLAPAVRGPEVQADDRWREAEADHLGLDAGYQPRVGLHEVGAE